eukprot:1157704-Pelagomonas_calceolata.AAC.1
MEKRVSVDLGLPRTDAQPWGPPPSLYNCQLPPALTSHPHWGGRCGSRSRWRGTCRGRLQAAPHAPSTPHPRTGLCVSAGSSS